MIRKGQFSLWGDIIGAFLPFFLFTTLLAILLPLSSFFGAGLDQVQQNVDSQIDEIQKIRVEHDLIALMQHKFEIDDPGVSNTLTIAEWMIEYHREEKETIKFRLIEELENIATDKMCGELTVKVDDDRLFGEDFEFGKCSQGDRVSATLYLPLSDGELLEVELEEIF